MPLVCLSCHSSNKKLIHFYQISKKYKDVPYRRDIKQSTNGIHFDTWIEWTEDHREDGVYCKYCNTLINNQLLSADEKILLKDLRMETWSFHDHSLTEVTNKVRSLTEKLGSTVEQYSIPRRSADYKELERPLPSSINKKLAEMGIKNLYSHQAKAINKVRNGENVIITTGTASGKSLIYTIPAFETFINDDHSTVLYLSPLKALTRDQLQTMDKFHDGNPSDNPTFGYKTITLGEKEFSMGILEGGKADAVKELTYQNARYWLTNAHYLHFILQGVVHFKNSKHYLRFFKNLKYVVLDELHAYNGVLGSKVSMLIRRLRILCKNLGNPTIQFIACSASVGNPKELAEEITGLKGTKGFTLIDKDGSPSYEKEILLWNPGMLEIKSENRTRRAPISEAIEILRVLADTYKMLPKTIFFYGNRRATTTASFDLNNALRSKLNDVLEKDDYPSELFSPFHAQLNGFKKQEIMNKLKKGELVGLVSTSALEMGIDIGDLSLCIMIGYAGSKAAFLQQAGRVGRKGPGLVIQLFQEDPLEQYYSSKPREFMEREPEHVTVDISNPNIVLEHLQYAAYELNGKISSPHNFFRVSAARKADGFDEKMIEINKGTWQLANPVIKYNNLLSSSKLYSVINQQTKESMYEGVDERSLLRDYHNGAVFLYNQRTYKVLRVLPSKGEIIAVPYKADYTTRGHINDSLYIQKEVSRKNLYKFIEIGRGNLEITRRLWGYKKVNLFGGGASDTIEESTMYPVKYTTEGLWIQFNKETIQVITEGAIHVIEHAIASAIPTIVKCSHNDFSCHSSINMKEFSLIPTIVLYETGGGGAGIMEAVEERLLHILKKGLGILQACSCLNGCPNCTHLSMCQRNNEPLDKSLGIEILQSIITNNMQE